MTLMAAQLALLFLLGGTVIRPYVPPVLEPEPPLTAAIHSSVVEIVKLPDEWDATVLARPSYAAPLIGHVLRGARVRVRGQIEQPRSRFCPSGVFLALEPFGFICENQTKPTTEAPTPEPSLPLVEGTPLPYRYAMVLIEETQLMPMWASVNALRMNEPPERQLARGDTVALASTVEHEGTAYHVTVDGKVLPVSGTKVVEKYSEWQGVVLPPDAHLPFGWVTPAQAAVFDAPQGKKIEQALRRTRLDILEEQKIGHQRWLRVGEGRWMRSSDLNEVRKQDRPANTGMHPQWVDVDLGEQVVVAYNGVQPVYATLTSSGREPNRTPRGNYPVWGKASAITMKSQGYDDVPYYVNKVPWVMFFQAHNALHGAYWHDRFGLKKSHGCVNLTPRDARAMFEWLEPGLPAGWTSVRYYDLTQAPVVHVRDSSKLRQLVQERNIGPPDKSDEEERLNQAIARREAEAAAVAAAGGVAPTGTIGAMPPTAAGANPAASSTAAPGPAPGAAVTQPAPAVAPSTPNVGAEGPSAAAGFTTTDAVSGMTPIGSTRIVFASPPFAPH